MGFLKYTHDPEQAQEYAESALARIRYEGLSATPINYELWYVYFSGQSPEVIKAIDILVNNKQKITEERCQELYHRFLAEDREEEVVRHAGEQIKTTIQDVAGAVRDTRSATNAYSGKLGGINGQIGEIKDPKELKTILNSVMSETETMLKQNTKLEQELDQSSQVMEELQRDLENVRREALTDGLTGLANRKAFDAELERIGNDARNEGQIFSLLMVDIDHFKTFNDNYGHQVGDQVLRLVAKILTDGIKGRDIAARYGGEEFALILPNTPLSSALTVAESLRKAVATKDVVNRNSGEKLGQITMSVGAAEYDAGETTSGLIERADAALYTAKHNGRNQVAAAPTPGKKQKKIES